MPSHTGQHDLPAHGTLHVQFHSCICLFVQDDGVEMPVRVDQRAMIKFRKELSKTKTIALLQEFRYIMGDFGASPAELHAREVQKRGRGAELRERNRRLPVRSRPSQYKFPGHATYEGFRRTGTLKRATIGDAATHLFATERGEKIPVRLY